MYACKKSMYIPYMFHEVAESVILDESVFVSYTLFVLNRQNILCNFIVCNSNSNYNSLKYIYIEIICIVCLYSHTQSYN